MGTCQLCGRKDGTISDVIGVCVDCLRDKPSEATEIALRIHKKWRERVGLPPEPPRDPAGRKCRVCVNECSIPEGGVGYCGVVENRGGALVPTTGSWRVAAGLWYYDPHPTNCVSKHFCPGATCRGYPEYTDVCGPETGMYNLAVFYGACGLDCVFCQNWEHKYIAVRRDRLMTLNELVSAGKSKKVTCVCYFGGDPAPFSAHAIAVSRELAEEARGSGRKFRVCWETNGIVNPRIFRAWVDLAMSTGGNTKIDFKAWTPSIHVALTGIDARDRVLENLRQAASRVEERPDPPPLTVSILLVPGYVDEDEVAQIAREVARLDARIPIVLLAFKPDHLLRDLPTTSRRHAEAAARAVEAEGIQEVQLANVWLLGRAY